MRILVTANSAWNIVNFRRPVVEALRTAGHSVTILAPTDDSVGEVERIGCQFISLTMNIKGLNPIDDLRLLHEFRSVFKRESPQVILSYTIKNNIFGALAAKMLRIPFIPNVTGLGTAFLSGSVLQALVEQLYRVAFVGLPVIFFQNTDDRNLFLQRKLITKEQGHLLSGSGINLQHFLPAAFPPRRSPPTFLMISRVLKDKGVIEFVEAARRVRQDFPRPRFQLLGSIDSENRSAIAKETVMNWHREGVIEYLGHQRDVRPFIAAAHCVVLPSYREGAPRTLIEAASMGRPVITTNVPGCRSVVEKDVTGLLCEARSGESLYVACRQFLEMPFDAQVSMGKAGREKMVREFDETLIVSAYQNAIKLLTEDFVSASSVQHSGLE
ncbi:glycosyltransferase family 4 protein [Nitratireductor aestuarii]|uniref:glycosyltransferase family 4 protein n=1 Tax=Nitratireductor aestuarii TaxID=1735103 RepID=UPI001665DE46|nr:glycosyltransferase family 4 protein [Nitratireductor aestuarii]